MRKRISIGVLLIFGLGAFVGNLSGQGIVLENKLPKSVPLKIEFSGNDNLSWWYDIEVKVTNKGKKPIYFL